jgi:gluconolactonase
MDDFIKPNGLAFSPDYKTLYVSDTGYYSGDGQKHPLHPRTIYRYDFVNGLPVNKRLFQIARSGIPDGIKVDSCGRVYAGCGDGIEVFNSDGDYLSTLFATGGGIANFAIQETKNQTISVYGMHENRILKWFLF